MRLDLVALPPVTPPPERQPGQTGWTEQPPSGHIQSSSELNVVPSRQVIVTAPGAYPPSVYSCSVFLQFVLQPPERPESLLAPGWLPGWRAGIRHAHGSTTMSRAEIRFLSSRVRSVRHNHLHCQIAVRSLN